LPRAVPAPSVRWTPQQQQALSKIVRIDEVRRVWMGSLESPNSSAGNSRMNFLVRRFILRRFQPFQPVRRRGAGEGILVHVNAELIIYGATEPTRRSRSAARNQAAPRRLRSATALRCRTENTIWPAVAVSPTARTDARQNLKIQPRDGISRRCRRAPAGPSLKSPLPEKL